MSGDLEELKRRLVLRQRPGGRCVYDKAAKAEFVELCLRPGVSVSRLAREVGINANQVSQWIRDHGERRKRPAIVTSAPTSPFVAVPVFRTPAEPLVPQARDAHEMTLQARLPNGVTVELRGVGTRQVEDVIQALGRLACSASTTI
ncbi:MAG: transposase [Roseateles sp.]|uniref:IS66-like element accessory protein TnpA n=1 Tax=Roseateles sp. TaxID=1971397 RepID=UPI0039E928B8